MKMRLSLLLLAALWPLAAAADPPLTDTSRFRFTDDGGPECLYFDENHNREFDPAIESCWATSNEPLDTNGNGLPDSVRVSDFDRDGTLETADIAAAVAALTDPGPKHVYVLPGDYAAPSAALSGARSLIELDSNTHFECAGADVVTIRGAHWIHGTDGGTVDRAVIGNSTDDDEDNITVENCGFDGGYPSALGFDFGDADTGSDTIDLEDQQGFDLDVKFEDHDYASGDGPFRLVAGDAALPTGLAAATDYWIIRVDADTIKLAASRANALAGTAVDITAQGTGSDHQIGVSPVAESITVGTHQGMGWRGVTNLRVLNNRVRHTLHTCLYASNAPGFRFDGNQLEYCGNYGAIDATATYAAIYLFSSNATSTMEKGIVANTRATRVATAFNTRGENPETGMLVQEILWADNVADRAMNSCFAFRTAVNQHVVGGTCLNSDSFLGFENTLTNYLDQDASGALGTIYNGAQKITIQDVHAENLLSDATAAIQIGEYADGVTLSNVSVDGTKQPCLTIEQPVRGLVLDGLQLRNCGKQAISVAGVAKNQTEGIRARNVLIQNVDQGDGPADATRYSAIIFNNAADWAHFESTTVRGTTDDPIRFVSGGAKMLWRNITVDCKPPRDRGPFTELQAASYVCDEGTKFDILHVTNSSATNDCTFASGTGAVHAWCMCDGDGTYTEIVQGTTIPDNDAIFNQGAVDDSVFENITGYDCVDQYVFGGTGAITDTSFSGIKAIGDTAFFNGSAHNPPHGALEIAAGSSNVLVDGRAIQCINTDGTVADCMAGAEDDLSVGALWVDDTCDAPCTNGSSCIDSNAATGSLAQCESAAWNVLD